MARVINVKCQFTVPVEVPDDADMESLRFQIEESGCPGTGLVWTSLNRIMAECNSTSVCWACRLGGTNQIMET